MSINLIGSYQFLRIDGRIRRPLEQHLLEARAGVDGVALWATGERAEPQRLLTLVDVPHEPFAWALYLQYTNLIRSAVKITINNVSWNDVRYDVLKVEMVDVMNTLGAVGGLYGGRTLLRCSWDVIARRIAG